MAMVKYQTRIAYVELQTSHPDSGSKSTLCPSELAVGIEKTSEWKNHKADNFQGLLQLCCFLRRKIMLVLGIVKKTRKNLYTD